MSLQQSKDQLLGAYRQMKTIREFEERLHKEIMTGEIAGFTHLYSGQEAVAVGVCQHLDTEDLIVSTHRGHGHCIAKGCNVKAMMAEIYGRSTGLGKGKGGSMHIADFDKGMLGANGIVGAGGPLAVGAALSAKLDGKGKVGVCFSGEGSINQGAVFEAMNMAKVINAPAIFIIEINGYSEHTGASYSVGGVDIAKRTEFNTTRFFGHYEGDPQNYREKNEVKDHRSNRDCLKKFCKDNLPNGTVTQSELNEIDESVMVLIDEAVTEARNALPTQMEEMESDVYISYE